MPAPKKFDEATRERAVRLQRDRLEHLGDRSRGASSGRRAARRHPATIRNWMPRNRAAGSRPAASAGVAESEEVAHSSVGWPSWSARTTSSRRSRRSRTGGARPPTQVIVAYIDGYRERSGVEPICAVLSEHGVKFAPSTYSAIKATPVSEPRRASAVLGHDVGDRRLTGGSPLSAVWRRRVLYSWSQGQGLRIARRCW